MKFHEKKNSKENPLTTSRLQAQKPKVKKEPFSTKRGKKEVHCWLDLARAMMMKFTEFSRAAHVKDRETIRRASLQQQLPTTRPRCDPSSGSGSADGLCEDAGRIQGVRHKAFSAEARSVGRWCPGAVLCGKEIKPRPSDGRCSVQQPSLWNAILCKFLTFAVALGRAGSRLFFEFMEKAELLDGRSFAERNETKTEPAG